MSSKTIEVDIDLSVFSNEELIEELANRNVRHDNPEEILSGVYINSHLVYKIDTLFEQIQIEALLDKLG